jgi:biopolymer transport protein ExbB/TolQ
MSAKQVEVNGTEYRIVLTEQVVGQVNNLKNLYNAAYEDPESFEDVSAEISNTINEIASNVEPAADDSDLDGLIQEIIKAVDNKAEEIEKELEAKPKKEVKKLKSKSKK